MSDCFCTQSSSVGSSVCNKMIHSLKVFHPSSQTITTDSQRDEINCHLVLPGKKQVTNPGKHTSLFDLNMYAFKNCFRYIKRCHSLLEHGADNQNMSNFLCLSAVTANLKATHLINDLRINRCRDGRCTPVAFLSQIQRR